MPILNAERIVPHSGKTRSLVVFLHGYGADGADLIDIGRMWQSLLPDTAFVSPHAPQLCPHTARGRQWFPLTFRNPRERWDGVNAAHPILADFLAQELQDQGLDADKLALVGFSQGCMMSLHTGLRLPASPASILGYSGMVVAPNKEEGADVPLANAPPVLLIHGADDEVIPAEALPMSVALLRAQGLNPEHYLSPNLGHGIDTEGLQRGGLFLQKTLYRT
jgi:phospholipase/carboxylesterase